MHRILKARRGFDRLRLDELWQYRELAFFLAWRDLLVRYKQTVIGVLWALARPLGTLFVLWVVFGRLVQVPTGAIPYPLFAMAGLLPWQLFASGVSEIGSSVVGNSQLVSKVYFPRLIIPFSASVTSIIDFFVSSVILVILMIWFHVAVHPRIVWIAPVVVLCAVISLGAGIWFAALFVRYRDVRHIVPFVIQSGIFISPVAFASSIVPGHWRFLYSMNPMVGVIDAFRWALFGGVLSIPALAASAAVSLLLLATGVLYFQNTERLFADII